MPHGISHHLGLDVHDVSGAGPVPKQLAAGHVITCEPGLYFIKPLIEKAAADAEMVSFFRVVVDRMLDHMLLSAGTAAGHGQNQPIRWHGWRQDRG